MKMCLSAQLPAREGNKAIGVRKEIGVHRSEALAMISYGQDSNHRATLPTRVVVWYGRIQSPNIAKTRGIKGLQSDSGIPHLGTNNRVNFESCPTSQIHVLYS